MPQKERPQELSGIHPRLARRLPKKAEFRCLFGTVDGTSNRLARQGYQLRQISADDIATATKFADEVVFTKPVVCLCNHPHARMFKTFWHGLQTDLPTCHRERLFRHLYIMLEVLEHAAEPGKAPTFDLHQAIVDVRLEKNGRNITPAGCAQYSKRVRILEKGAARR
jgi:hypothetical protein